jgi:WD40 repeat protein
MPQSTVATLANRSPHPYSSITMSPNRQYAIIAGKETLQLVKVLPSGLFSIRSMKLSSYFQVAASSKDGTDGRSQVGKRYGDIRDTFGLHAAKPAHTHQSNMAHANNVVVTCVAWSMPLTTPHTSKDGNIDGENARLIKEEEKNSYVAVAGSNGVVLIWNARQAFFSEGSEVGSSTVASQQPEATLSQHTRAVNRLAWHPRRPGLLLTASQVRWMRMGVYLFCVEVEIFSHNILLFHSFRMQLSNYGNVMILVLTSIKIKILISHLGSLRDLILVGSILGSVELPLNQRVKLSVIFNGASFKTTVSFSC